MLPMLPPYLDGFRPQSFDVNTTSTLTSDPTAKNKFTFIQQSPITVCSFLPAYQQIIYTVRFVVCRTKA